MEQSEPGQPVASAPAPSAVPEAAPQVNDCDPPAQPAAPPVDVIIVGFGLPGRFVAEVLDAREIPYAIIELNPSNAKSIAACGKRVICGDARNVEILKSAGIEGAKILALTLPDEKAVIEVLHVARRMNPNVKMLARCNYTSTGIKAEKAGATAVLVEEQLMALEFAKLMSNTL
jgi:voltage-gated potassium channel Kch